MAAMNTAPKNDIMLQNSEPGGREGIRELGGWGSAKEGRAQKSAQKLLSKHDREKPDYLHPMLRLQTWGRPINPCLPPACAGQPEGDQAPLTASPGRRDTGCCCLLSLATRPERGQAEPRKR